MNLGVRSGYLIVLTAFAVLVSSCGGGGGSQTVTPVTPADFSISLSPSALTVGNTPVTFSVSVNPSGGFSSQVAVSMAGLPTGVSASPASFTVAAGGTQTVTLTSTSASSANGTLTLTGTSGGTRTSVGTTHSASVTVQVLGTLSTRIRYFSTGSVRGSFAPLGPVMVYNAATRRFFYLDAGQNQLFVFDAKTEKALGSVSVPGGLLLDQASDGSVLYAGTAVGDIYVVDPQALSATRIVASTIGPSGYQAYGAFGLADGRLVLLGDALGAPTTPGYVSIAVWDRGSNSLIKYVTNSVLPSNIPGVPICNPLRSIAYITVNAAKTKVFLGGSNTDTTVCEFDPSTGQAMAGFGSVLSGTQMIAPTPDGSNFFTLSVGHINVWNTATMTMTDQFAMPTSVVTPIAAVSNDGSTVYTMGPNSGLVLGYNWRTHAYLGWTNAPSTMPFVDFVPMVIDETGLMGGASGGYVDSGVEFVDVSSLHSGPYAAAASTANAQYPTTPNVGTAGTNVQMSGIPVGETPTGMYFDYQGTSAFSAGSDGMVSAAAPAHAQGPVDVAVATADGGVSASFDAFSYGPSVVAEDGTTSTAEGGGTATIWGYGFAALTSGTPANPQVTVGGQAVAVTALDQNLNLAGGIPLQQLTFTIPAGSAGSTAAIKISNQYGSVMASRPITYLPAVQTFSLPGAALTQGVYDARHQLYYFTDASQIRVFSRSSLSWQNAITIPDPSASAQQFTAIALSPDGTRLAVADAGANYIYVLNTNNLSAAASVFALPAGSGLTPNCVAISDAGSIYYTATSTANLTSYSLNKLDPATGVVTQYSDSGVFNGGLATRVLISPDNGYVYFNGGGYVFQVATATDQGRSLAGIYAGDSDLAFAPAGNALVAGVGFFDASVNARANIGSGFFSSSRQTTVAGEKFSADGSLLFEPQQQAIRVVDVETAMPLETIPLPVTLNSGIDNMVTTGTDNMLAVILNGGGGIALIDLSTYVRPAARTLSYH